MQNLDDSSLIEIFSYLDKKDIIAVTRVCSRWFNLVNTGKIMEKLQLVLFPSLFVPKELGCIFEDSVNLLMDSPRKYRKIKMVEFKSWLTKSVKFDLPKLFKKLGETVLEMKIISCNFRNSDTELFLQHFPKVKRIYFERVDILTDSPGSDNNQFNNYPPFNHLEEVTIRSNRSTLELLKNAKKVKIVTFMELKEKDADLPLEWLVKQENLKELTINDCHFSFKEDISAQVKFQLVTLKIENVSIGNSQNFEKFVITQKKLKKFVFVANEGIQPETFNINQALNHVFNLTTLDKLEVTIITEARIDQDILIEPNENLKSLRFHYYNPVNYRNHTLSLLKMKFPNVTNLDIKIKLGNFKFNEKMVKRICQAWPELERLQLADVKKYSWSCVKLENLNSLRLHRCVINKLQRWKNLAEGCPNLTSLVFVDCDYLSDNILRQLLEAWKLRSLEITDSNGTFEFNDKSVKILQEYGKFLLHFHCTTDSKVFESSSEEFMNERGFTYFKELDKVPFEFFTKVGCIFRNLF